MPPRLSKRQQREQEELEALAGPSKTQDEEDMLDDDLDIRRRRGALGGPIGFAAVGQVNSFIRDI